MNTSSSDHTHFDRAYASLNQAQKEAVDTIEGPVMVIAGPGTGKTQILTLRIAQILLKTDTSPDSILALTFTEAGARAMRERLAHYIGDTAYRVTIATFHEFAGKLIREYPDAYVRAVGGRPATDLEKVRILESIIETEGIKTLRPHGNPAFYLKPIQKAISDMKREYITPDAFRALIASQEDTLAHMEQFHEKGAHKGKVRSEYQKFGKYIERNRELLFIYRAYESALAHDRLYDFDDMIYETVGALETNEDMLRDLQERYHYILADEHQDVNGAQNRILELLASFHERPNIFVVGDEKQAIYRFQGASLENFLFFEEKFPHTKTIALTINYRSGTDILDTAHALITEHESVANELRVALTSHDGRKGSIEERVYVHEGIEDERIVEHIGTQIHAGVAPEDIAIIVRSNREVELFASLLRKAGIRVRASADSDILNHPLTEEVRTLITAFLEPHNEEALFLLIHAPYLPLTREERVDLLRARSATMPLSSLIAERVPFLSQLFSSAHERTLFEAPHLVLSFLLTHSGLLDFVMKHDPFEGGRVLRRLYDEIESLVRTHETATLHDVATMFALRTLHNLPLTAPYIHTHTSAVNVMTAHKSKGLEFSHVYIPHLTDRTWGDTTRASYFMIPITKRIDASLYDALDDERKLFYVALTRAKNALYLSYARENLDGKGASATPLLEGKVRDTLQSIDTIPEEEQYEPLSRVKWTHIDPLFESEILRTILRERGLSATALNNYLESPWTYVYRNILRIPEVQPESAQFGTALHNALCRITRYHTQEKTLPSDAQMGEIFTSELQKLPLGIHAYTRLHERGLSALLCARTFLEHTLPSTTREEYALEAHLSTDDPLIPTVRLTGKLDRLDFDDEGNLRCVIDYKTGKPRTRGEIEGTTKESTGNYKRQLVFYALLLSLQSDTRLHSREGVLVFIEPDAKGIIREERYTIEPSDIEALRTLIIECARDIAHGAFLNAPCEPGTSPYCHLVESLRKL